MTSPKELKEIVEKVEIELAPVQSGLEGIGEKVDVETVVEKTVEVYGDIFVQHLHD